MNCGTWWPYQKLSDEILGLGEKFLWEFVLQLYYLLEYKVLISTTYETQEEINEQNKGAVGKVHHLLHFGGQEQCTVISHLDAWINEDKLSCDNNFFPLALTQLWTVVNQPPADR